MRRFVGVIAVLMAGMLPVYAAAQATPPAKEVKQAAGKIMSATGSVTAVTADSLTVKAKSGDMTFTVDSKTKVTGTGAGTKSAELKDQKKPTVITEFIKVGDNVTVSYHDMNGTKMATGVRLMKPIPK